MTDSDDFSITTYRQGLFDGSARCRVQLNRAIKAEAIVHAMLRHMGAEPDQIRAVLGQALSDARLSLPDASTAERRLFAAELVLAVLRLRVRDRVSSAPESETT